jgi:hypothetical protein
MPEEIKFPSNISRLVNRRKELSKKRSMEAETEIFDVDNQLYDIKLFYFAPQIDLDTPKKILEMAGLFAENEAIKVRIQEKLKGTDYEGDFDKTDGGHLIDGDLKDILAIRKEAARYIRFREIIENADLSMNVKLRKLSTFANSHEKMIMDNMHISEKNIKAISEAGLNIADYMLIESFSNWGLSASFLLYTAGIRTKDDFLSVTPDKLLGIKGFGKQSLDEFYSFVETIKNMNNFSVDIWAFNDIDYSYKSNFNIDFFNSIENTLLAYTSFGGKSINKNHSHIKPCNETKKNEKHEESQISKTEPHKNPPDISRIKKRRKGFWIAAIIFGIMGLLSIPTVIWAIIYLAISGFLFLAWKGANDIIKEAEKNGKKPIQL